MDSVTYPGPSIPGISQDSGTYTPCPSIPGFPSILGVSQDRVTYPPVQVSQDSLVSWVYPRNIPGQSHLPPCPSIPVSWVYPQDSGTYTPCPSIPGFLYPRNIPGQSHLPPCPSIPGFLSILGVSPGQWHLHPLPKYPRIP